MKKIFIALTMALLFGGVSFSSAADPKPVITEDKPANPGKSSAKPKKQKSIPFNGPVAAIDKTAKTVTVGKNKLRVFQITGETKISKDKKPATLDQISIGEFVGGSYRETADGKLELMTLNAGDRGNGKKIEDSQDKPEKKRS